MRVFPIWITHPFDASVQRPDHANSRKHCWPVMFGNQYQRFHRGLPFVGVVLCLPQLGDVQRRIAQGESAGRSRAPSFSVKILPAREFNDAIR
jgi:hypothetical protein